MASYAGNLMHEVEVIAHSCGLAQPRELNRTHAQVINARSSVPLDNRYRRALAEIAADAPGAATNAATRDLETHGMSISHSAYRFLWNRRWIPRAFQASFLQTPGKAWRPGRYRIHTGFLVSGTGVT